MLPGNIYSHSTDVEKLDKDGNLVWALLHDYKETYKMQDLRPSNFKDLAVRILLDPDLAYEFMMNITR